MSEKRGSLTILIVFIFMWGLFSLVFNLMSRTLYNNLESRLRGE